MTFEKVIDKRQVKDQSKSHVLAAVKEYFSIISTGETMFFLDLLILIDFPTSTPSSLEASCGESHLPSFLNVLWQTIPCVTSWRKGSVGVNFSVDLSDYKNWKKKGI